MPVTLQQIAEAAGVSRGTVDRALKDRGRVRPEVAEKIKKIAKDMGYQPSLAGRALEYMERMGIKNTQFFIAQHFDTDRLSKQSSADFLFPPL